MFHPSDDVIYDKIITSRDILLCSYNIYASLLGENKKYNLLQKLLEGFLVLELF